jgi:5-methylcytosine-specific restriction protein A
MPRLTNLKPRVSMQSPQRVASLTVAEHVRLKGADWQRLRDQVMTEAAGLCQCPTCSSSAYRLPAHEVDHRIPLWQGGDDSIGNLQAMNRACHALKTALEARQRARGPETA